MYLKMRFWKKAVKIAATSGDPPLNPVDLWRGWRLYPQTSALLFPPTLTVLCRVRF